MDKVTIKEYAAIAREVSKQEEPDIPSFDEFIKHIADKNDFEFFLKNRDKIIKRIKELEAKLAESNESHHKNIVELTKIATEKDKEIDQLKQQLAEKEKLIEFYIKSGKEQCDEINKINHNALIKAEEIDRLTQSQNQTAIAELEKVKERFNDRLDNFYLPLDHRQTLKEVFEQIDQQIKSLKRRK